MKRLLPLSIFIWLQFMAFGQNCGLDSSFRLRSNSRDTLELSIFDLVNDSLSNPGQGVCSVDLHFLHSTVGSFEVWLVSPAGQEVQLIGPNASVPVTGLGFTYDVTFISTRLGLPANGQWDNDQPNPDGSMQPLVGEFFPYQDGLQNFNVGPVNGNWLLVVQTSSTAIPLDGSLFDVKINFCDDLGENCCFPEGGAFAQDSTLVLCEGDSLLQELPDLDASIPLVDSTVYGYTYLLVREGEVVGLDSSGSWAPLLAGNYQMYGLSYARTDSTALPIPNSGVHIDTLTRSLDLPVPPFCGDLTSNFWVLEVLAIADTAVVSQALCLGDSLSIGDSIYTTPGIYDITLQNANGCDSLIRLNLSIENPVSIFLDSTICSGDSVGLGEIFLKRSGLFTDTLMTMGGCDSIVTINLRVTEPSRDTITQIVCNGQSVTIDGQSFNMSGIYDVILKDSRGCDSVIVLDLTVLSPLAIVADGPRALTCTDITLELDGRGTQPSGNIAYRWERQRDNEFFVDVVGRDSILRIDRPGNYFLQADMTVDGVTCSNRTSVITILMDTIPPLVEAGPDRTLSCLQETAVLGSGLVMDRPDIDIIWSAAEGAFPGDSTVTRPVVTDTGTFFMTITDLGNGCSASDSVNVTSARINLTAMVPADTVLTCDATVLELTGAMMPPSDEYILVWYERGDSTTSLSNTNTLEVSQPGTYILQGVDPVSLCSDTDTVVVGIDTLRPDISLPAMDSISCASDGVVLDASNSFLAGNTSVSWLSLGGIPFTEISSLVIEVNQADTLLLILENQVNGCSDSASVVVTDSRTPLNAVIQSPLSLDCSRDTVRLDGSGSEGITSFDYVWSTQNGRIIGDTTAAFIDVDAGGTYRLEVRDNINGCTDFTEVEVMVDTISPLVVLAADTFLHCANDIVHIENTALGTSGPMFGYAWSGPCISDTMITERLSVNCGGIYQVRVTNLDNACVSEAAVQVDSVVREPVARVASDSVSLSCTSGEILLDARSSENGIPFWFFRGVEVSQSFTYLATDTGEYQLVIQDASLGCTDSLVVLVDVDCQPEAQIVPPLSLDCTRSLVTLDGSLSMDGNPLAFEWIGPDSNCVSDPTQSVVKVSCAGEYMLIVTNTAVGVSDTATVMVPRNDSLPLADAGTDQVLDCLQGTVSLDGSNSSSGPGITYLWRNDLGDTTSTTATWSTNIPGIYFLEVQDQSTGCQSEDVVEVTQDIDIPEIQFGASRIPCNVDTFLLEATVLPDSNTYEYTWSGVGIVGSTTDSFVQIIQAGDISLQVLNSRNGCSISDTISLDQEICGPCITIQDPDTITCRQTLVSVTADLCSPCVTCTFSWTTATGMIQSSADQNSIIVTKPAVYTLRVTDSQGVSTTQSIEVFADTLPPVIQAISDQELNCQDTSVVLGSSLTLPGDSLKYIWLTAGLDTLPLLNDRETIVYAEGRYLLMVTEQRNGCTSMEEVIVQQNNVPPNIQVGSDQELNCGSPRISLDASGSSEGPAFVYQWETPDGLIQSGAQSLSPVIEGAGSYILTVRDTTNQCTTTDTVRVVPPTDLPEFDTLDTLYLGCNNNEINVEAPVDDNPSFMYAWSTENGMLLGEERVLTISQPGHYNLRVWNENNDCADSLLIVVAQDSAVPAPNLPGRDTLRCDQIEVVLESGISETDQLRFTWRTARGLDLSDQTGSSIRVTESDSIFLLVENLSNGCFARDTSIVVSTTDRPVIRAPQQDLLSCYNPTIDLKLSIGGDLSDYVFLWSTTDGSIVGDSTLMGPTVSEPGRYTLITTNVSSGCQSELFVIVDADRRKPEAALLGSGDGLELTCTIQEVTLDASTSISGSGAPLVYQWDALDGSLPIDNLDEAEITIESPVSLQLIVLDTVNGCRDSLPVEIVENIQPPLRPQLSAIQAITCREPFTTATIRDFAAILNYQLITGNDTIVVDTGELTLTEPSDYWLRVIDPVNGCISDTSFQVSLDTLPPTVMIEQLGDLGCRDASVRLSVAESNGRLLSNLTWVGPNRDTLQDSALTNIEVYGGGLYTLVAEGSDNGCLATASVVVNEAEPPIDSLIVEVELPGCDIGSTGGINVTQVIGGEGPYLYGIVGAGPLGLESVFDNLSPSIYMVRVEDINGCRIDQPVEITADAAELQLSLGSDIDLFYGDSVVLEPEISGIPTNYRWTANGMVISLLEKITVRPTFTTSYNLSISSSGGCITSDQITVFVLQSSGIYMPNIFAPDGLEPQNQRFFVQASNSVEEVITFQIFDRWGEKLFEQNNFMPNDPLLGWDGTHQGQPLNAGVYVYYIKVRLRGDREEVIKGDVTLIR